MDSIIDRRVFFKIAATGVAGYFVSPMPVSAQVITTTPGATIMGTARNCIFFLMTGAPSQIDVPLRYAVVREGVEPKTIVTKLRRVPVTMTPGSLNVLFTDIEEDLSFAMPPPEELLAYIVYVGFDEVGLRSERQAPAKKKKGK